ncbi:type II secretory pathway component PulF [Inhella inkyongensis]|uniref:Type II secretory pathway component PulF n=1 Tax=Inhella inkyongensis TaxID=392593 RepID=A0A840S6S0_9BURK|nr:type II secretion system F family protein [Inhella inkyongensis]MBB5204484.1 type II secretory pathway component PulF [Inhella inkyongensis]
MKQYSYVALDAQGVRRTGTVLAEHDDAAKQSLHRQQLVLVKLQVRDSTAPHGQSPKVGKAVDAAQLVDELATLLEASVPLAEAVGTLAQAHPSGHPLHKVRSQIRAGSSFSQALLDSGLDLPNYVEQLVRSGETTGKLGAALRTAASHLEQDRQFRQEARNALIYPMVLVASGIVATLVMFIFVVPRFAPILTNPKAELPWLSRMVLNAGLWLTQNQIVVGGIVAGVILGGVALFKRRDVRAAAWEFASRLPVLGPWTLHSELARWASLLAVLLQNKVPLLTALAQANQTFRRQSLHTRGQMVLSDVRAGKALSSALAEHAMLDVSGLNMIRVGERSGTLPHTVASLARLHANQSQQRLKRFLVLLEPITILAISVVLGGIMISVMLAITSLTNVL